MRLAPCAGASRWKVAGAGVRVALWAEARVDSGRAGLRVPYTGVPRPRGERFWEAQNSAFFL